MNNYKTLEKVRDNIVKGKVTVEDVDGLNEILELMDKSPLVFYIPDSMCISLRTYFTERAGYISHESDLDVHRFFKDLDEYVRTKILKEPRRIF